MSAGRPSAASRPPGIARALLARALPSDVRDDILGDLDEAFAAEVAAAGRGAARRRYRRKAATLAVRFTIERWRERLGALRRLPLSALDLRLAIRMVRRYPVLSSVSTISLACAVAIGAMGFAVIARLLWPSLPMPDGDRIVRVQLHDDASNRYESRLTADFLRWRAGTTTLEALGAWDESNRNMTMGDGTAEPVTVAEVTPSMFALGGAAPVFGRGLTDDDARPAAPAVVVIGQRIWREKFGADPGVVGRRVLLAGQPATIVGVLPEPYRFPVRFEIWQPLKLDEAAARPRDGRGLDIWARLNPGATVEAANQEMTQLVRREAADWPATHTRLTPIVRPFARSFSTMGADEFVGMGALNLVFVLLIVVVSGNVALLMFARASTRESEIVMRFALGAGRARIVAQFAAESVVLSGLALAAGWMLARWGMQYGFREFVATFNNGRTPPFWYQPALPAASAAYAIGVALLATLVTGVMPALKVTRGMASRLRASTPGAGGVRFGGVWTVLIVAQIALTMAVPVTMYFVRGSQRAIANVDIGVPQSEYLIASLAPGARLTRARFVQDVRAIRDALPSIPGVSHATVADRLPFFWHGHYVLQLDEGGATAPDDGSGHRVGVAAVDPDFFEHFEMTAERGRVFTAGDYVGRPRVAVVNQLFVDRVLGGRNPIGRRVKFIVTNQEPVQQPPSVATDQDDPWLEIVGVVRDVCMGYPGYAWKQGLYIPLDLRRVDRVWVTARVPGAGPGGTANQAAALRTIAAKADPTLLVTGVQTLPDVVAVSIGETGLWVKLLGAVSVWVMLLALSGIYAVMSFAVSQRTREIGIRLALGSDRSRVVLTILRRPIVQLSAGIVAGTVIGTGFGAIILGGHVGAVDLTAYIALLAGVCVLATVAPVRRAMAVDPTAALRNE